MSQTNFEFEGERVERDASPRGQTVRYLSSDTSPMEVIIDQFDNHIDSAKMAAAERRDLADIVKSEIYYYPGGSDNEERVVIKSNTKNGVEPEDIIEIVRPGGEIPLKTDEFEKQELELIAEYGVGGTRPFALGESVTVKTNHPDSPACQYQIEASTYRSDYEGESDIQVELEGISDEESPEEGWVEIIITDLSRGFDGVYQDARSELGKGDESDDDNVPDSKLLEPVAEYLGRIYSKVLRDGIETKVDSDNLTYQIELFKMDQNENEDYSIVVEPVDIPEYARLPFDNLRPRIYKNVPFGLETEGNTQIEIDVTVGLHTGTSDVYDTAGLYQRFVNRYTHFGDLDSRLFSSSKLGSVNRAKGETRFLTQVELREPGRREDREKGSSLPLSSTKGDYDHNSEVTEKILGFIARATEPYKRQNYQKLPGWMLDAYIPDKNPELDVDLLPDMEVIEKSGATTNNAKANRQPGKYSRRAYRIYPERDTLAAITMLHAYCRIRVEDPANYIRNQFNKLADLEMDEDGDVELLTPKKAEQFAVAYNYYFDHVYPDGAYDDADKEDIPKVTEVENQVAPDIEEWRWWSGSTYPDWRSDIRRPHGSTSDVIDENGLGTVIKQIAFQAEKDVNEGIYDTDSIDEWKRQRYTETAKRVAEDFDSLVTPTSEDDSSESDNNGDTDNSEQDDEADTVDNNEGDDAVQNATDIEIENQNDSDQDVEAAPEDPKDVTDDEISSTEDNISAQAVDDTTDQANESIDDSQTAIENNGIDDSEDEGTDYSKDSVDSDRSDDQSEESANKSITDRKTAESHDTIREDQRSDEDNTHIDPSDDDDVSDSDANQTITSDDEASMTTRSKGNEDDIISKTDSSSSANTTQRTEREEEEEMNEVGKDDSDTFDKLPEEAQDVVMEICDDFDPESLRDLLLAIDELGLKTVIKQHVNE